LDELAEKMENVGADPEIKDLEGNFVGEKSNKNVNTNKTEENNESNIKKNIMNIFSVVIPKPSNNYNSDKSTIQDNSLDTDNFINDIKLKINKVIGKNNEDSSSSSSSFLSSEYKKFPKTNTSQISSDTLNSDKFFSLLGHENKPKVVNYSDIDDNTDQFIATLTNKYNSISETDKHDNKKISKQKNNNSDTLASVFNSSDINEISSKYKEPISSESSFIKKFIDETTSEDLGKSNMNKKKSNNLKKLESETSSNLLASDLEKFIDETTSEDFVKSNMNKKKSNNLKKLESETSSNSLATDLKKYINETTSDESDKSNESDESNESDGTNKKSNYNIFLKKKNLNSSEIDTDTLLGVIKKIQENNITESDNLVGGDFKTNKQQIIGHRKLIVNNFNSQKIQSKKLLNSDDYNELYNSDSDFGKENKKENKKSKITNNELSRMMISQKEKIHKEVLEMIMGMLNNGLLTQSNKPIEASERNAKLIKSYIYRQISEKNPQMGGMDKIMVFKAMNETDIINIVKKMPELDELEKSILKHLEEKKTNKKTFDISETSEASDNSKESDESEKPKKKSSKKSAKK
jgi:hypothetical protein